MFDTPVLVCYNFISFMYFFACVLTCDVYRMSDNHVFSGCLIGAAASLSHLPLKTHILSGCSAGTNRVSVLHLCKIYATCYDTVGSLLKSVKLAAVCKKKKK